MRVPKKRSKTQTARHSKSKGKGYEHKIAKVLSDWWGSPLHRTPTSGAHIYSGDIVDDSGELPFIVECKKRRELTFSGILEKNSRLWKFWEQTLKSYRPGDPHHQPVDPCILVFSQNFGSDYFMIATSWFESLEEYCGIYSEPLLKVQAYPDYVVAGKLKDFLEHFDPEMIKTIPGLRRSE